MNRKDTEKVTEKDTEKDTERDTEQPKSASRASELVSILAPRRTPKDGCRFRCILCAVGRVKADRRGPKGHPGLAGWGLDGQGFAMSGEFDDPGAQQNYQPDYQPDYQLRADNGVSA